MKERNLRPKIHFTPPSMWMNDPNGMFYEHGNYHLFYQYHPESCVWGPMHWGHAVSEDLITWEHLPIALYPDELGMIFSGSCVYDVNNLSGFGTKENSPVIAMYTSHGDTEQQSIAYSLDKITFIKVKENPVIPNTALKDFRDPKMFYNEVKGGYTAVIAAGDRAMFYFTKDFTTWGKTGEFGPLGDVVKGVWECPDMIKMDVEGEEKWVFVLSPTQGLDGKGHKTFYFVGEFDGDKFIQENTQKEPLPIDVCCDNYAGVIFQNATKPIFMGWALCWAYAKDVPTGGMYRGQMTLARELRLVKTSFGYRLKSKPVGLEKFSANKQVVEKKGVLKTSSFGIEISGTGTCKIVFSNLAGDELVLELTDKEFIVDRSKAGLVDFNEEYKKERYLIEKTERVCGDEIDINIVFDVSVVEAFCNDGLIAACTTVYPQSQYTVYRVEGDVVVALYKIDKNKCK